MHEKELKLSYREYSALIHVENYHRSYALKAIVENILLASTPQRHRIYGKNNCKHPASFEVLQGALLYDRHIETEG